MPNLTLKLEDKVFLEETTYSTIADDPISGEYFHKKLRILIVRPSVALCIGSNLGLKFGRERPIRVLLPHLAEPKIYK